MKGEMILFKMRKENVEKRDDMPKGKRREGEERGGKGRERRGG